MKLTFLGSGGGRFATISQKRMTGGFRIDDFNGKNYHIDPGPGALVRCYQFGVNPTKIDGVFVSHSHTDHYNDAEILIEAMTRGMTKNNGIIMGSRTVFEKFEKWGPALSKYHQSNSKNLILVPNKVKHFPNLTIKGCETQHGDPTGVGFQMEHNDFRISYTADTSYFEKLPKYHKRADIFVDEVKPKLAVMTHFGFKMLSANPVEEALRVASETGVRTLAAFDGMRVDINRKYPERSRMIRLKDRFALRLKQENVFKNNIEDKSARAVRQKEKNYYKKRNNF